MIVLKKKYKLESFLLEFHRLKAHKGLLTIVLMFFCQDIMHLQLL